MINIQTILDAWKPYLDAVQDWSKLVEDVTPKQTGCGPVYELPNPINRPNESFAIADMRNLRVSEPHYHTNKEIEVYYVLQGSGLVVVGYEEYKVQRHSVIIILPDTAHFTIPTKHLVLAVINAPPFKPENYVVITEGLPDVSFDYEQFVRLTR
ncbi:MAG: AraC family ligand binding domain-containing protein [Candidatus Aenigmarchaeota archaeon]|nr:AraC family ligand binding domain-containing protein [Candidatus Aenigmarchaeota archaeon]